MLDDLQTHLRERMPRLKGHWLHSNSGYEDDICKILDMKPAKCRFWDAQWRLYCIEFKKGRSIWIDLVRYSEIALRANELACQETICLFFVPDKKRSRIEEIICVETTALVRKIGLTEQQARLLIELQQAVPHSLNAQASLTVNDLKKIKAFSVP